MSNVSTSNFWQGTNFWMALSMAIGSIWGLTEADVSPVVSGVFGILGALLAVRERIKNSTVNWKAWASSPNTWNYVFAAVATIVPSLPAGLGTKLAELIAAVLGKNWPSVITAALSLLAMLYFMVIGGRGLDKTATTK